MLGTKTPVVNINGIFAKLECVHPTGSVKDRIAKYILERSKATGMLQPGQHIIEATSGNTGIALSFYGRELGHPVTIVMPENMTEERKDRIRSYGANLILCSVEGSFAEAASIRDELAKRNGWFNTDQFSNPLNTECHEKSTGDELIDQMAGVQLDAFVAGVGTGGTLIGVGRALKRHWPNCKVIAVEPAESAVMSGGKPGPHQIFGIGDGFIPEIASNGQNGLKEMIDEVVVVSSQDAIDAAHYLREQHGFCIGISSGANYLAATQIQSRMPAVATVFSDGYAKYISHGLCGATLGQCEFQELCAARA